MRSDFCLNFYTKRKRQYVVINGTEHSENVSKVIIILLIPHLLIMLEEFMC